MDAKYECPKCGSLTLKSMVCLECGSQMVTKDKPKMDLQKCITESDCSSTDTHK